MDERIIRDPAAYTGYAVIETPMRRPKVDSDPEWLAYVARCKAKRDAAIARAEQEAKAKRAKRAWLPGELIAAVAAQLEPLEPGQTTTFASPKFNLDSMRYTVTRVQLTRLSERRFTTRRDNAAATITVTRVE